MRTRPPTFSFVGGKSYLVDHLLRLIPPHRCWAEVFAGSAVVTLSKPRSPVEVINDINGWIVNFFLCMRDHPDELIRKLKYTPYSRALREEWLSQFKQGRLKLLTPDIELAARWFSLQDSVFSGKFGAGWGHGTIKNRAMIFHHKVDRLYEVAERLRGVMIECRDGLEVIRDYDSPETAFYLDPPYIGVERVETGEYYGAWSVGFDHEALARLLHGVKGKVILSYYPDPRVDEWYSDWFRLEIDALKRSFRASQEDEEIPSERPPAKELLLLNYNPYPLFAQKGVTV